MAEKQVIFGMRALASILSGSSMLSWMLGEELFFPHLFGNSDDDNSSNFCGEFFYV